MASSVGSTLLPDVGTVSYNGVVFSCLFHTSVTSEEIQDDAERTVKYSKKTLTVEGVVVLDDNETSILESLALLRVRLSKDGGKLVYRGRGYDLVVNGAGSVKDVAWGPKPTVLEFTPLGAARSALIKWTVTTCVYEGKIVNPFPIVQFAFEYGFTYDEDGYTSGLYYRGILEVPMTRINVNNPTISQSADQYRGRFLGWLISEEMLTRFRVVRRNISLSKDKRILEWDLVLEELPPMGLPPGATKASGTFTIRQGGIRGGGSGPALAQWNCNLRCTYTIRKDWPRRAAYYAFMSVLMYRMAQSVFGGVGGAPAGVGFGGPDFAGFEFDQFVQRVRDFPDVVNRISSQAWFQSRAIQEARRDARIGTLLIGWEINEGMYLDSKQVTFSATWYLATSLVRLMRATGLWRTANFEGGQFWAQSMKDILRWKSWDVNNFDTNSDAIIDMGS